jgi:hypothetical protein
MAGGKTKTLWPGAASACLIVSPLIAVANAKPRRWRKVP